MGQMKHVRITLSKILSQAWYTYKSIGFDLEISPGNWESQKREVLDRGNGATILLLNKKKKTIILTRQFRIPTYLNGNSTGYLIEACAGSIEENESPEANIIREVEEETGFYIKNAQKIFEAYMSPGAVTEIIHFFVAEIDDSQKISSGGGNPSEHEFIEVLELIFSEAVDMISRGEIRDAKTIMLIQYAQIHHLMG